MLGSGPIPTYRMSAVWSLSGKCGSKPRPAWQGYRRAFRWRDMLESGQHATVGEIASTEKVNESYVGRLLRLTLLAPDIVEAILAGRQPAEMTLAGLMRPFPVGWREQRTELLGYPD
jgi:hypothetical protein